MNPCPACGAAWRRTELISAARVGGGYRIRCGRCAHEWDDPAASHGARADAVRIAAADRHVADQSALEL